MSQSSFDLNAIIAALQAAQDAEAVPDPAGPPAGDDQVQFRYFKRLQYKLIPYLWTGHSEESARAQAEIDYANGQVSAVYRAQTLQYSLDGGDTWNDVPPGKQIPMINDDSGVVYD